MNALPNGIESKISLSYSAIEEIATDARKAFRLHPFKKINMSSLFEFSIDELRIKTSNRTIPLIHGVENLTTEALTRWNPESEQLELLLSEEWYEKLCANHPRASFTVAHELGHALLHTSTLLELGDLNLKSQAALHRGLKDHPVYRDTEWQANSFAAAFMMPFAGIQKLAKKLPNLSSSMLANHFDVSLEAAHIRLDVIKRGKLGNLQV